MSDPIVFGKYCGLGCREKVPYPDGDICCQMYGYSEPLKEIQTINQLERTAQCFADFPVECKDCPHNDPDDTCFCLHMENLSNYARKENCPLIAKPAEVE